ncbi:glycine zipper family protein [Halobacillus salinus]|uniref:glycine zipper family protein n=1 Tax=Halobacillus salinus TaxID=192814 RepID=UPI0009A668C8|nr:glycine zipper family protein [Halobacillus salinus]
MSDEKDKSIEHTYLAVGIGVGLPLGAALGLLLFDDIATGAGVGLVFGITIGTAADSLKRKR